MSEDQWMASLVDFSTEGKPYPEKWYNKYSPVVIQDDFNGITMAAFSFPENIKKIWLLVQMIKTEGKEIKNNLFPRDFEIGIESIQYYLIKGGSGKMEIIKISEAEMKQKMNRTTTYGAQLGKKIQLGFIKGP